MTSAARLIVVLPLLVPTHAWEGPVPFRASLMSVRRAYEVHLSQPPESEQLARLQQLFGNDAAKIAENTGNKPAVADEYDEVQMQMLVEGIQLLEWGAVRLVDVAMAEGPLEAALRPMLPNSQLLSVRLDMPLGMLLEETDVPPHNKLQDEAVSVKPARAVVVAELLEGSSAAAGGVKEGDLIRATTAVKMAMSYPTWQLMMGGIGKPTLQKVLFPIEGQDFEAVMAALASNSKQQQGNGQVVLFIERRVD